MIYKNFIIITLIFIIIVNLINYLYYKYGKHTWNKHSYKLYSWWHHFTTGVNAVIIVIWICAFIEWLFFYLVKTYN